MQRPLMEEVNMKAKKINLVLLVGILIVALFYLKASLGMRTENAVGISQATYPLILAVLLIGFVIIDFIQTIRAETPAIKMTNFTFVLGTIAITAVYFFLWSATGYFYPLTFVILYLLLMFYKKQWGAWKNWILNGLIALVTTVSIYFIFGMLLSINFV